MRAAARSVGQRIEILQAGTEREVDTVFESMIDMRVDALLIAPHALFATQTNQLVALAARHAIPTLYWRREFVEAGGLMSYGSSLTDACHFAVRKTSPGTQMACERPDFRSDHVAT